MDRDDERPGPEPTLVPSSGATPRERMEAVLYELSLIHI